MAAEPSELDPLAAWEAEAGQRRKELLREPPTLAPFYRVGHRSDPLGFVPRDLCSWANRWDDPLCEYRTLYCARTPITCLREALAPLRPSAKTIEEFHQLFGPDASVEHAYGRVSSEWIHSNVLVAAQMWHDGELVDMDDPDTRFRILDKHASLLVRSGVEHLDAAEVATRTRTITQAISRSCWEEGAAGIRYRSTLDGRLCLALFEGRGGLYPTGWGLSFSPSILRKVARRYNLRISVGDGEELARSGRPVPTNRRSRQGRRRGRSRFYRGPERRSGIERRG